MVDNDRIISAEKRPANALLAIKLVRFTGVIFFLAGTAALLNIGGVAGNIIPQEVPRNVFGASLCFVGILDVTLVPFIMKKAAKKQAANKL